MFLHQKHSVALCYKTNVITVQDHNDANSWDVTTQMHYFFEINNFFNIHRMVVAQWCSVCRKRDGRWVLFPLKDNGLLHYYWVPILTRNSLKGGNYWTECLNTRFRHFPRFLFSCYERDKTWRFKKKCISYLNSL